MKFYFFRKPAEIGGPDTFLTNFLSHLSKTKHEIIFYPDNSIPNIVFVISGTKHILKLIYLKYAGSLIVQRLDGTDFSVNKKNILLFSKAYVRFFLIRFIRRHVADLVIYQSKFIKCSWTNSYGHSTSTETVIYNGASDVFFYNQKVNRCNPHLNLICVEGSLQSNIFSNMILSVLNEIKFDFPFSVDIYGDYSFISTNLLSNINFRGIVSRSTIPHIYNSLNKCIFLMLERNPPCPNSLIEAMCSGVPSIGLDEGSFKEITGDSSLCLKFPFENYDLPSLKIELTSIVNNIYFNYKYFSNNAVKRSSQFSSKSMCSSYLSFINKAL